MKKNRLSVTIIALNEENNIERCIESVKEIADEIVVVDSGSIDKTVELAMGMGARVFYNKFKNYAKQKNYAATKARGEWILSLDADEEISPELAKEIAEVIRDKKSNNSAYSMPRKNIIFGKLIKYSRWQSELDRHVWFWKKSKGKWVGRVHEEVIVKGKVGELIHPKIHYQYDNVAEFLRMMNKYSELDAQELINQKVKFSLFSLFIQPIYNFSVRYLYRLGFLDSWRGFMLSYLMAIYHFELWVKVWEKGKVYQVN